MLVSALAGLFMVLSVGAAVAQGPTAEQLSRARATFEAFWEKPDRPLDLQIRTNERASVRQTIGAAGGSITLDTADARFTLEIPPDHLFFPAEITLTPITTITGLGPNQRVNAVRIGPAGIPLAAPVWLTVAPKRPDALANGHFGFGFSSGGQNAHYAERIREGDSVHVLVTHFSGFGMGFGGWTNMVLNQTVPRRPAPDAAEVERRARAQAREQQAIQDAINAGLAGDSQPGPVDFGETIKSWLGGASGDRGTTGRGPSGLLDLTNPTCASIERTITTSNEISAFDRKNPRRNPRSPLPPETWAA
jgi:hypothetical protein